MKEQINLGKQWFVDLPIQGKIFISILTILAIGGTGGLIYVINNQPPTPKYEVKNFEKKDLEEQFLIANSEEINRNIVLLQREYSQAEKSKNYQGIVDAYFTFTENSKGLMELHEKLCFIIYPDGRTGKPECDLVPSPNKSAWSLYKIENNNAIVNSKDELLNKYKNTYIPLSDLAPKLEMIQTKY